MRHLVLIVLSIAQIFIAEAATQQADAPKPNIVHIFVDDIGWQDIASHKIDGNAIYETPNLGADLPKRIPRLPHVRPRGRLSYEGNIRPIQAFTT